MTKKHFIQVADALTYIHDRLERKRVAIMLANVFAAVNADFKRERFMAACGL